MGRYKALDCLDLALDRYAPAEMTDEEHEEFVSAAFELADLLKDDLDMDWEDVGEFIAENDDGDGVADDTENDGEFIVRVNRSGR